MRLGFEHLAAGSGAFFPHLVVLRSKARVPLHYGLNETLIQVALGIGGRASNAVLRFDVIDLVREFGDSIEYLPVLQILGDKLLPGSGSAIKRSTTLPIASA